MIVGHALLAFALAAALARRFVAPKRVVPLAALAGGFAVIPDVDIAYGVLGVLAAVGGTGPLIESFWTAGLLAHRGLTHSLVVGAVVALALGLTATHERPLLQWGGGAVLAGVVVLGSLGGPLAAVSAGLFVFLGLALTRYGVTRLDARPATVVGLAALGLLSHPFGDLFTGDPPPLLYPLLPGFVPERIVFAADPTLHLLGTFAIEVLAAWVAVLAFTQLRGDALGDLIAHRALAGGTFGLAAFQLDPPTLETPYLFTASILPIAAGLGASCWVRPPNRFARPSAVCVIVTGLATLSVALITYTAVYLSL